jgi:hypothetical protein
VYGGIRKTQENDFAPRHAMMIQVASTTEFERENEPCFSNSLTKLR